MAMPRPKGKALKIAENTIPGFPKYLRTSKKSEGGIKLSIKDEDRKGPLSAVEVAQTNNIERR